MKLNIIEAQISSKMTEIPTTIFDELPESTNDGHLTLPIHPTAFIFPSKLGNSLLFCVQGFTLLINGGNEACPYWRLIRHLQRLVESFNNQCDGN